MGEASRLTLTEANVLEICRDIEETCASMYWYFSKLFAENEQQKQLWKKTAMEEDDHAHQFSLALRLRGAGMSKVKVDAFRAKTILHKLQSVYDAVQKTPPSPAEALRFAIKIELSLAEYHMDVMVSFADPQLCKMFTTMKNADRQHVEQLQHAYDALLSGQSYVAGDDAVRSCGGEFAEAAGSSCFAGK